MTQVGPDVTDTSETTAGRCYADLHEHIERLDAAGLLYRIDAPINKDTEMHPLVRWQFRGGIQEKDRRAFLFTNIVDSKGRRYDMPMIVGAFAASSDIYRVGMNVDSIEKIGPKWAHAMSHPVAANVVTSAPCQEIVLSGAELEGRGQGLESLPIPISTPGFDAAPYLTATCVITSDPETGTQNMGTYRAQLKSPTRLGMMMAVSTRPGGFEHWKKYQALGRRMPICLVVGCPPIVGFLGPQKLPIGVDEIEVAGGLAGGPINMVHATSVDLMVPAESELVIEGYVDPDYLEPEGPFGESHGYVALEEYSVVVEVTAITRRRNAILTSIISQVTPSESSVVKRLAYEPQYMTHLRDHLAIKGIKRVSMHEPLTNLRRIVILQFAPGTPRTEIWRALYGTLTLQAAIGKFVIAVDEDIDPESTDAVFWAMSYRCNPAEDTRIVDERDKGHGPRTTEKPGADSAMLVDATMKHPMPPLALPKREFMENAKALWERLDLPQLRPEAPWFGYSLGDWTDEWDKTAMDATRGDWMDKSESYRQRRRKGVDLNTPCRSVPPEDAK
ncbi:MAG: carboxylase [Hyphomicrobiales bacterium]|nr:carboxylase [Hyphomicrobiales bacterium]